MYIHNNLSVSSAIQKTTIAIFLIIVIIWGLTWLSVPVLEDFLVVDRPLQHADALVVMAGEVSIRLPAAARLFKEGKADKILLTNDGVFSAWSEKKQRNLYQVEWAEDELLKMQVPGKAIVKLSYSSSGTIHDALNTRKYLLDNGVKSIIIVTSDYHTRRSLWSFEKVLRGHPVTIGVFPVKSRIISLPYYKKIKYLSQEMIKFVYYKCRYSSI